MNRQCGTCDLCCTVVGVTELDKPPGERCGKLARVGSGCTIYNERPESCGAYRCAWLAELLPLQLKPNLIGLVVDWRYMENFGLWHWAVIATKPKAIESPEAAAIMEWCGAESLTIGYPEMGAWPAAVFGPKAELVQFLAMTGLVAEQMGIELPGG